MSRGMEIVGLQRNRHMRPTGTYLSLPHRVEGSCRVRYSRRNANERWRLSSEMETGVTTIDNRCVQGKVAPCESWMEVVERSAKGEQDREETQQDVLQCCIPLLLVRRQRTCQQQKDPMMTSRCRWMMMICVSLCVFPSAQKWMLTTWPTRRRCRRHWTRRSSW